MNQFPSDTLNEISKHLDEEKKRITTRLDELTVQDPFSDIDRTVGNSATDTEASEESDHDRMFALMEALKSELSGVEQALDRIKNGTYGFCVECGEMIDTDRLAILPTAMLCMKHQEKKSA